MNKIHLLVICLIFISCNRSESNISSVKLINEPQMQKFYFEGLIAIIDTIVPEVKKNDSLAFVVLPVQASCPGCRKKTIDSIIAHRKELAKGHYIIISANGGRKTISSYFREEGSGIPKLNSRLILDSTNQAQQLDLYDKEPTMYYAYNQRVYKRVAAIPATVREDLREFFSGYRKK